MLFQPKGTNGDGTMKKISILLCLIVFLFSLSAIGGEPHASGQATFTATELLGRPTDSSVTVNVLAVQDLEVYFE